MTVPIVASLFFFFFPLVSINFESSKVLLTEGKKAGNANNLLDGCFLLHSMGWFTML